MNSRSLPAVDTLNDLATRADALYCEAFDVLRAARLQGDTDTADTAADLCEWLDAFLERSTGEWYGFDRNAQIPRTLVCHDGGDNPRPPVVYYVIGGLVAVE